MIFIKKYMLINNNIYFINHIEEGNMLKGIYFVNYIKNISGMSHTFLINSKKDLDEFLTYKQYRFFLSAYIDRLLLNIVNNRLRKKIFKYDDKDYKNIEEKEID